jgi:hypothetical protein
VVQRRLAGAAKRAALGAVISERCRLSRAEGAALSLVASAACSGAKAGLKGASAPRRCCR